MDTFSKKEKEKEIYIYIYLLLITELFVGVLSFCVLKYSDTNF